MFIEFLGMVEVDNFIDNSCLSDVSSIRDF